MMGMMGGAYYDIGRRIELEVKWVSMEKLLLK